RTASASPTVKAVPDRFQFVVKAIDQKSQLGLPGLTAQILDSQKPGAVLASGSTDGNGSAVLFLTKEQADSLANDKMDLTLTIVNSSGKMLFTAPNVVCAHANRVETQVATIAASGDTAAALGVAIQFNAADSALLASLNARGDQLKTLFANRKQDIQDKITQIQNTITAIQAELKPGAQP